MNETELRERLRELSHDLPDAADLGPLAWAQAEAASRRARRTWGMALGGGLAAAAATVLVVALLPGTPAPPPSASATGSASSSGPAPTGPGRTLRTTQSLGVTVHAMVPPEEQLRLPAYPDPGALGLPERLGWDADAVLPELTALGGVAESVRAVMLRKVEEGVYHPVLYIPDGPRAYVEVDLRVTEVGEVVNGTWPPPIVIHPDRHRIAILQRDGVLGLDARTGTVTAVRALGGTSGLQHLGWTPDGQWVIASGRDLAWRLDPFTPGSAHSVPSTAYPGRFQIAMAADRLARLSYTGTGSPDGRIPLPGPVGGVGARGPVATVTNDEGWSATSIWLTAEGQRVLGGFQGLYAVQVDNVPRAQVLVEPMAAGAQKGCCSALWWGPQDTLVLRADSPFGSRLLAWDVINGRLWRVSELPPTRDENGEYAVGEALDYVAL